MKDKWFWRLRLTCCSSTKAEFRGNNLPLEIVPVFLPLRFRNQSENCWIQRHTHKGFHTEMHMEHRSAGATPFGRSQQIPAMLKTAEKADSIITESFTFWWLLHFCVQLLEHFFIILESDMLMAKAVKLFFLPGKAFGNFFQQFTEEGHHNTGYLRAFILISSLPALWIQITLLSESSHSLLSW